MTFSFALKGNRILIGGKGELEDVNITRGRNNKRKGTDE
jgi:hypothetical protein